MLIIVPPSETKAPPPEHGRPVAMGELSFPELTPARVTVAAALIETSVDLDAFERLGVGPGLAPDVVRNTRLFELPAMPALDVYTGPLHQGLDAASLAPAATARAHRSVVVVSPLWGLLRPTDRIPPYRLGPYVTLLEIGRVDHFWRDALPGALAGAAGPRGVIVDLRTAPTRSAGMPAGLGNRTVILRVNEGPAGHRIGAVLAKRARGEAARYLLESGADPGDAQELADVLADRWPVRLDAANGRGKPWTMTLAID